MVRPFLFLAVLALLACHVLAAAQESCYACSNQEECDQKCRDCPDEPNPQGMCTLIRNGICKRCATCTGKGEPYNDPEDGSRVCCEEKGASFRANETHSEGGQCCKKGETLRVDAESGDGECCDEDHHPLYDATTGESRCCPVGMDVYEDGKCTKSDGGDDDDDDDDDHDGHCGDKVCPKDHHDLGFEYGACYKIKDMKGRVLSRRYGGRDYLWDTAYANIAQFQICKTTSDCSHGGHVHPNDTFYLRDELGDPSDTKDQNWWIGEGNHYSETNVAALAKQFQARFYCGDKCGICLKGFGYGVSVVCPADNSGLGTYQNPHYCYPVQLVKVPCLEELEKA